MRRSLPLACSLVAVVTCGTSRLSFAGQPNSAGLFGVDLGTPWPVLEKVAKASLSCREVGRPTNALICEGALVKWGRVEPESTTFWVADRRVSGIFEVSRLTGYDYPQSVAAFRQRLSEMTFALGRPPTIPVVEPAKEIDDEQKMVLLAQGRLGLKAVWRIFHRDFSLALHGERGTPVLVVGLEPAPPPSCDALFVLCNLRDEPTGAHDGEQARADRSLRHSGPARALHPRAFGPRPRRHAETGGSPSRTP